MGLRRHNEDPLNSNQWMWLLCQNKASHIYIHKAYTDCISLSNKQSPGASWWLSWHVIPFCLSQLFLSLATVNYQIKVKLQKSAACDHWCSCTHLQRTADSTGFDCIREQNVNATVSPCIKGLVKQLCSLMDITASPALQLQSAAVICLVFMCQIPGALRISAPVTMDTHYIANDSNFQLWHILFWFWL